MDEIVPSGVQSISTSAFPMQHGAGRWTSPHSIYLSSAGFGFLSHSEDLCHASRIFQNTDKRSHMPDILDGLHKSLAAARVSYTTRQLFMARAFYPACVGKWTLDTM